MSSANSNAIGPKRILYVTTVGGTMRFFTTLIRELLDEGYVVDIATNELGGESRVPECYREWGCNVYQLSCTRSPLDMGNLRAIREIRVLVNRNHYDIVHCHTPIAAACTRLACKDLRKEGLCVVYTAHGFHFYAGAPAKSWILYYPIEWLCSWITDMLITINKEDYERAKSHLHAKMTVYVPGVGVDTSRFDCHIDRQRVREELGLAPDDFLLVSVGELNGNKNHIVVIRALGMLDSDSIHYAIAGNGPMRIELEAEAKRLGLEQRVHLLGYRDDIPSVYAAADVCVFPSIREGLGLASIEGMASGLPLIVSDNRGTRGFVGEKNGITCSHDDAKAFAAAITELQKNQELRKRMGSRNRKESRIFDVGLINIEMKRIYESINSFSS